MLNKLNVPSTSAAADTVEIQVESASAVRQEPVKDYAHPANRNPSEWRIDVDGDKIVAVNNTSRDTFKGLIEDFNKILRG